MFFYHSSCKEKSWQIESKAAMKKIRYINIIIDMCGREERKTINSLNAIYTWIFRSTFTFWTSDKLGHCSRSSFLLRDTRYCSNRSRYVQTHPLIPSLSRLYVRRLRGAHVSRTCMLPGNRLTRFRAPRVNVDHLPCQPRTRAFHEPPVPRPIGFR